MIDIDFDDLEQEINKAEDYLSFAPTPKATPKGSLSNQQSSSASNNIFFYDQEVRNADQNIELADSLADTIRFTIPTDSAIRSIDYSSRENFYENAHQKSTEPSRRDPEFLRDEDDEDSLPRSTIPVAKSPVRVWQNPENVKQKTKPRPLSIERIQELHQSRLKRQQNLLKERKALDELALAECTFKPEISKGTRAILHNKAFKQLVEDCRNFSDMDAPTHSSNNNDNSNNKNINYSSSNINDVSERLFREASVRTEQHRWVQHEVEKIRQMQCTFQPMLNPRPGARSSDENHRPIYERLADMQKQRQDYMSTLKKIIEDEDTNLTFHPQIDDNSRKIAQKRLTDHGSNPYLPSSPTHESENMLPQRDARLRAGSSLSGEAAARQVLGFHVDVGSRLMNDGKRIADNKQRLLHERESELAKEMQSSGYGEKAERILNKSKVTQWKKTFEERQDQYRTKQNARREKLLLEQENITRQWFSPLTDHHSHEIVRETRPELFLESAEQRADRLAVKDAVDKEERQQRRVAEAYGAYTFTPSIDPISRALGRSNSIQELVENKRALSAREEIRRRVEEEHAQACTFHPQINELSKELLDPKADEAFIRSYAEEYAHIGWAEGERSGPSIDEMIREHTRRAHAGRINMQEPEKMLRDIRAHELEKEQKRRAELMVKEIEEMRDCTFQPSIDRSIASLERQRRDTSPVVVRGLGRYLELKHMSAKQREDALQREREVFSVKNIDKYRRAEDGSTIIESFKFSLTEPKQHSRLDISTGDEISPGSLNASTIISHRSHRHATSPEAINAWCL